MRHLAFVLILAAGPALAGSNLSPQELANVIAGRSASHAAAVQVMNDLAQQKPQWDAQMKTAMANRPTHLPEPPAVTTYRPAETANVTQPARVERLPDAPAVVPFRATK